MNKRILVLDDEEAMLEVVASILRATGYEVEEASNGAAGLERLKTWIPDLIVCDVNMPNLNGFGFLQEVRKSTRTSDIPFIFLTGEADQKSRREGMMLGADDYITKPFSEDELVKAVEVRLKKRQVTEDKLERRLEEFRKSITLALPHEFRTPLTGILGFAELLEQSPGTPPEDVVYIASHIRKSAKRLHHLLERVLLLSELDNARADLARVEQLRTKSSAVGITLSQIVEEAGLESERRDDIRLSISDATVNVLGSHLARACDEILSNALKFSKKGSTVDVKTSVESGRVVISISDAGLGMSREQIQKVGAFMQFDRDRNEQQGSGLGLALVKKICDLYNGSLNIERSPSGGTMVILVFPAAV